MEQLLVMEFASRLSAFKTLAILGGTGGGKYFQIVYIFLDIGKNMVEELNGDFTEAF